MQVSKNFLAEIYLRVNEMGIIDDKFLAYLDDFIPNISGRVLETIKRGISKYIYKPSNRIVWVAMGKNDEYLIYPKTFCSCHNFYNQILNQKEKNMVVCKHILAQIICEALNEYKEIELDDSNFSELVKDLKLNF